MPWKMTLLIVGSVVLGLGVLKVLWDQRRKKRGRRPKRDIVITLVFSLAIVVIPRIIDMVKTLKPTETDERLERIEEKLDKAMEEREGVRYYEDGIPESENFNLRKLFEQGTNHLDRYEYEEALRVFRRAWALSDLKPSERVALLIYLGIAQYSQAKWDQASASWKDAYDAAVQAHDKEGQVAALNNLGIVYKAKGEWDKAIDFYQKDLAISNSIGDEHGMAKTYNNLGIVYEAKGEWSKAIEFYEKSLGIKEKIGDEHGMAQIYGNPGNVYQLKGEWSKAIGFYEKASEGLRKIGDEHGMAQTYGNLGNVYQLKGE